jgi:hypothetical protein
MICLRALTEVGSESGGARVAGVPARPEKHFKE